MSKQEIVQAANRLIKEEPVDRDFRDTQMRRVDGALREIKIIADELLDEVEKQRSAGNWDLEPTDLEGYLNRVRAMDGMVGRLRGPGY